MLKTLNRSTKVIVTFLLLTLLVAAIFQKNLFNFSDQKFFDGFQRDSESLVVGSIVAEKFGIDKHGFNLGIIKNDKDVDLGYGLLGKQSLDERLVFTSYKSQYGIQGVVFSKIAKFFGFTKVSQLQSINSIFFAIVVVSLFFLYKRIYDNRFAMIFLIVMISSPWIISFASNLYWSPFLWFLPALFSAIMYLTKGVLFRSILLFGIGFAVFIKSLAGYEYLSTITLFTGSVFVVAPYFKHSNREVPGNLKMFFLVFVVCVIGFICALLVHANMRGDSIISGLKNILEEDVKRRTYGDPSLFDPVYKASLESSSIDVLKAYIINWKTSLITWLPGSLFKYLVVIAIVGIYLKFSTKHISRHRDAFLFLFFFITPVSWFILAKGHSYIHTHMNYVLWYFGFIQALIYVCLNTVIAFFLNFLKWAKTADIKDF